VASGTGARGSKWVRLLNVTVSDVGAEIAGPVLIEPGIFSDDRGFFYESYNRERLSEQGIDINFVQDNHSRSQAGVVRGLHYQGPAGAQWRLVRCTVGAIFDVIVDLRVGSATLGRWIGVRLSAENKHQLLIPPPFAHGFCVLSDVAEVQYKCSGFHDPSAERALSWSDRDIGVKWPLRGRPIISEKDANAPSFAEYLQHPDFPDGWTAGSPGSEENR
jgi:dTDP-4-dehydrorhamnose 3,5-epimerase